MRSSDWSADVCSSDLGPFGGSRRTRMERCRRTMECADQPHPRPRRGDRGGRPAGPGAVDPRDRIDADRPQTPGGHRHTRRSEEHTSELQSLMRISYAVFCLQKQNMKTVYLTLL